MDELEKLKYDIYKKTKKSDYITFNQFKNNDKIAMIWSEYKPKKVKSKCKKGLEK